MTQDNTLNPMVEYVDLKYSQISLYDFGWFDLSQFSDVYGGQDVSTYETNGNEITMLHKDSDLSVAAQQISVVLNCKKLALMTFELHIIAVGICHVHKHT